MLVDVFRLDRLRALMITSIQKEQMIHKVSAVVPKEHLQHMKHSQKIKEEEKEKMVESHTWRSEAAWITLYTLLSIVTRVLGIGNNSKVVWDEAHFGKFASYYINREFYLDVHPPLGKMIVALVGKMVGYTGDFSFESGANYPDTVDFVSMRFLLSLFGALMVPLAFATSSELAWNSRSRHLLAIMVLVDNGWLVISRFILLDSILLFFTTCSVLGLVKLHANQHSSRPLSVQWLFWLIFTGTSLGCVMSVKWVGFFVTALVGLYTITDLWSKLGEQSMTARTYTLHWITRIIGLIVIPVIIYIASFWAHFAILYKSGPGDSQMSSLFQANLFNTSISLQAPPYIAYGSKITLKNDNYGGGLLHSHIQTYPSGSNQQQVTCYHHRDANNDFVVQQPWGEQSNTSDISSSSTPRFVRHGDVIRLVHAVTSRSLHSHPVVAPLSKIHHEVSCYGNATYGDAHDHWRIEVIKDVVKSKQRQGDSVERLTSRIRFRHESLGCYLASSGRTLPEWGFKQAEVYCDKSKDSLSNAKTYWNIEEHTHASMSLINSTMLPRTSFLSNFIHLNVAMLRSNNALLPDPDKEDNLASKPLDWPLLYNGLRMNSWDDDNIKYYLMGNPIIWWTSTCSLLVFVALWAFYQVDLQRGRPHLSNTIFNQFFFVGGQIAGLGWLLHFVPFLFMGRTVYLHHYLPTLYFAVIMLVHLLDHLLWNSTTAQYRGKQLPLWVRNLTFIIIVLTVVAAFWTFRMNAYGLHGPASRLQKVTWRSSWTLAA